MTDTTPEPDDTPTGASDAADELVGAVLDGEATPEDEATVAGDPVLRARLEEFRALRTILSTDPATLAGGPPDELAVRRRGTTRRVAGAVGVAAAATLLLVGGLSSFRSTDGPDVVATGSPTSAPVTSAAPAPTIAAESAERTAPEVLGLDGATGTATGSLPSSAGDAVPFRDDCALVTLAPDGRPTIVGGAPCTPLQPPAITSGEVAGFVASLLATSPDVVVRAGVGTGPTVPGDSCDLPTVLGRVVVTDRPDPGVLVGLDPTGTSVLVVDPTTCAPI